MNIPLSVFWFRRDLRLDDNAGLYHALKGKHPVLCLFIFDTDILNKLEDKDDKRVTFIWQQLKIINNELKKYGTTLLVKHGTSSTVWKELISEKNITSVFTNHDYEPDAIARDENVKALLQKKNINFHTYKDQVLFEKNEITKDDGKPYSIYTPYSRKWLSKLNDFYLKSYPTEKFFSNFFKDVSNTIPSISEIGFIENDAAFPSNIPDQEIIKHYKEQRDFPSLKGTTHLSVHLRFGTVSIRKMATLANKLNATWLNELCWREFYQMILWHFPHVVSRAFKPAYNAIPWRNDESEFDAWCNGQTGYPIVDAGMRELNETGFMHNRVRMIVASFLTKHLLIDWRWGEAYFAHKLIDFELASNNGGWQWAAGTGCDAAPYFRIFNPYEQTKKFDPQFIYIKKWVPEFQDFSYPPPIIDHKFARERCLKVYAAALGKT
ncbi:MAG: deoxyribodipyrimidine photo-lyase [Bacteroidota bacterium]